MWINRFGQYVLNKRRNAIMMALIFAVLPFLNWVSIVIVALVTMQKGAAEGFLILLWAVLPSVVLAFSGAWLPLVVNVLGGGLFVWCLAVVLKRFSNWRLVLEIASGIGIITIFGVHIVHPDIHAFWSTYLLKHVSQWNEQFNLHLDKNALQQVIPVLTYYITGIQAVILLVSGLIELMLARAWASKLFVNNQWRQEWSRLRLSYWDVVALLVGVLLAWWNIYAFRDILPILLLPFGIAGLSLIHGALAAWHVRRQVLLFFYMSVVLAVIFFPVLLSVLIIAAIIDSFWNLRARIVA